MGKKRSKKRQREHHDPQKQGDVLQQGQNSVHCEEEGVNEEDLAVTVTTLERLSECDYHKKVCKPLRTALHPYYARQLGDANANTCNKNEYPLRATVALQSGRWSDALFYLRNCAQFGANAAGDCVKRGTIQRWVRLCDGCSDKRALQLRLIRAILQCSTEHNHPISDNRQPPSTAADKEEPKPMLQDQDDHTVIPLILETARTQVNSINPVDPGVSDNENDENLEDDGQDNIVSTEEWFAPLVLEELSEEFQPTIVHRTLAKDRKPPNRHDLVIYTTPPHTIVMDNDASLPSRMIQSHVIDPVPGAILLTGVLSPSECHQLMCVSEAMGYQADHPITEAKPSGIDACEWLVDSTILSPLVQRVLPHLPNNNNNKHDNEDDESKYAVAGINARWRLFRYGKDGIYRPHVDGSWPKSGLNEEGTYSPPSKDEDMERVRSRYTFLMYLNDGFDGGTTTFYLPAPGTTSGLKAVRIRPKAGAVLIFPQGNTASLVHEGAQVTAGGYKYVIRSDVLYEKR